MRIVKSLIVLISLSFVFACGSAKTENTQNNNNPEGRKKYAKSLTLVKIGGHPAIFDAMGTDNKTLSADLTDDITEKDCSDFAKSKISQDAAKIGFDKLSCRNLMNLKDWSFPLN